MNDIKFGLSASTLERIRAVLARHPQVKQVLLYGSRAKGNYRDASDIDLALLGADLTDLRLSTIESELDDLMLPYTIDLCRFSAIDNPALVDHIQRVGKVFYP